MTQYFLAIVVLDSISSWCSDKRFVCVFELQHAFVTFQFTALITAHRTLVQRDQQPMKKNEWQQYQPIQTKSHCRIDRRQSVKNKNKNKNYEPRHCLFTSNTVSQSVTIFLCEINFNHIVLILSGTCNKITKQNLILQIECE